MLNRITMMNIAGFIACLLCSTTLLAQTFFGSGAANTSQAPAAASTGTTSGNRVMAAEEFNSYVKSQNEQYMKNLTPQTTAKAPPIVVPPPTLQTPQTSSSSVTNNTDSLAKLPASQPAQPTTLPTPTPTPTVQAAPTNPLTPKPSYSSQANTAQGAPSTQPTEAYTGFGTGNNSKPTTNNTQNSGSSSGWNIKY